MIQFSTVQHSTAQHSTYSTVRTRIDAVQEFIGIDLLGCSKVNDFKLLRDLFQEFKEKGSCPHMNLVLKSLEKS
eukprot:scaffold54015_cov48-Attheya_sp.AAC.2